MQKKVHPDRLRWDKAGQKRALAVKIVRLYNRTELNRILPVGQDELAAPGAAVTHKLLSMLGKALRSERRRGRAGHWTYDLGRHAALAQAIAEERLRLAGERENANKKAATPIWDSGSVRQIKNKDIIP